MSEHFKIVSGLKTFPLNYPGETFLSESILLISDFSFYVGNEPAISDWIKTSKMEVRIEGMIIEFRKHSDMIAFLLRWGS